METSELRHLSGLPAWEPLLRGSSQRQPDNSLCPAAAGLPLGSAGTSHSGLPLPTPGSLPEGGAPAGPRPAKRGSGRGERAAETSRPRPRGSSTHAASRPSWWPRPPPLPLPRPDRGLLRQRGGRAPRVPGSGFRGSCGGFASGETSVAAPRSSFQARGGRSARRRRRRRRSAGRAARRSQLEAPPRKGPALPRPISPGGRAAPAAVFLPWLRPGARPKPAPSPPARGCGGLAWPALGSGRLHTRRRGSPRRAESGRAAARKPAEHPPGRLAALLRGTAPGALCPSRAPIGRCPATDALATDRARVPPPWQGYLAVSLACRLANQREGRLSRRR